MARDVRRMLARVAWWMARAVRRMLARVAWWVARAVRRMLVAHLATPAGQAVMIQERAPLAHAACTVLTW